MLRRYLSSAPIGLAVTLSLLYTMHVLIDSGNDVYTTPVDIKLPAWTFEPPAEEPPVVEPPPKRIEPPPTPPSPTPPNTADPTGSGPYFKPLPQDPTPTGGAGFDVFRHSDGPLVHMVRVEPVYPAIAISRGLEGFVTVRFDVTADGRASNIAVVESSNSVFDKAAIRAAQKFRFKPKVVDGVAVASAGIVYRFRFEMKN